MSRAALYFSIAALTALTQAVEEPKTRWDWLRLISTVLVQGFVALKALESLPKDSPIKTEVVNKPSNPVPTDPQ